MDWQGKSVVVTGAGTGIGKAVSKELARRGAVVYVTALSEAEAQLVVDDIIAEGHKAVAAELNVTDYDRYQAVFNQVVEEQGTLDVVINNAGIVYVGEYYEMDEAYLDQLVQINLNAVMIGTLYAYRIMKEQGHGLIANVASQGGIIAVGSMAAYSATKHAVVGLGESVGGEAAPFGVQVQTICPGNVASELLAKAKTRGTSEQQVLSVLPKAMATDVAARYICDNLGSKKNRIIVTFVAQALTVLSRIWPGFGRFGAREAMIRFRKSRNDAANQL